MGERGSVGATEKRNSLSLAWNQTPIPRSNSHSLCYYSEIHIVSSYYIKASRTFKNNSFKDYGILKDNNKSFLSCGSLVQIL